MVTFQVVTEPSSNNSRDTSTYDAQQDNNDGNDKWLSNYITSLPGPIGWLLLERQYDNKHILTIVKSFCPVEAPNGFYEPPPDKEITNEEIDAHANNQDPATQPDFILEHCRYCRQNVCVFVTIKEELIDFVQSEGWSGPRREGTSNQRGHKRKKLYREALRLLRSLILVREKHYDCVENGVRAPMYPRPVGGLNYMGFCNS